MPLVLQKLTPVPLNLPSARAAFPHLSFFCDVSKWQKAVDWEALAPHVDGVIIKASGVLEDGTLHKDGWAQRNTEGALKNKKTVGFYHYARQSLPNHQPAPSGAEQAAFFVQSVKDIYATLPVPYAPAFLILDLEPGEIDEALDYGWAPRTFTGWVKDFLDTLRRLAPPGCKVEVYYSGECVRRAEGALDFLLSDPSIEGWISGYPGNPRWPSAGPATPYNWTHPKWGAWQYTSKGTAPGVDGDLDLNICRPGSDFERIMRGGRAAPPASPAALAAVLIAGGLGLTHWLRPGLLSRAAARVRRLLRWRRRR